MCNSNGDDDNEALEGRMDEGESKLCSGPTKTFLFILNLLIWLGSCGLLAIGIFGLVDSPYARNVADGHIVLSVVIIFIIVGGLGFIISFIGCCGALRGSKCLIITYVVILSILLAIIFIGLIIAFLYRNNIENIARDQMLNTLRRYNPREEGDIVQSWDVMQKKIMCCGVSDYKDWQEFNDNFKGGTRIPQSCCRPPDNPPSGCESANNEDYFFSSENEGCKDKLVMLFEKYTPIVAGVAAGVALVMVLGLCLGCIACSRL
ncbi:UNVERIFIED_CONTAM: hypothetical protein RMT77_009961 [Armadillidium vulgare]